MLKWLPVCVGLVTKLCNDAVQVSERHLEEVHMQELEKSYRDMHTNLLEENDTANSSESSEYESADDAEFNYELSEKISSRFTHEGSFSYV